MWGLIVGVLAILGLNSLATMANVASVWTFIGSLIVGIYLASKV